MSPSEAGDNSEKGFRDSLILETLYEIWRQYSEAYIVFISNDELTRSVATEKKGQSAKRLIFPSLSDLHSHLKLLADEHNQKFVSAVLANVTLAFYKLNDPNCVYTKFNVPERIYKNHSPDLNPTFDPESARGVLLPSLSSTEGKPLLKFWNPLSEEKVFLGTTRFESVDLVGRYIWKSQVNFVRLYGYESLFPNQNNNLVQPATRRIRIAHFDVVWTSIVSDAEISDPQIQEIVIVKKEFEIPTLEKCVQYNVAREMGFTESLFPQ